MSDGLLDLFKDMGALLEGHFLLSSGLHSPRYLQCARVLMHPDVASRLGADLASALRHELGSRRPAAVVSPALGGILVGHEVARAFGVPGMFTERQEGSMTLRRGFALDARADVVVVEDVITTAGSTREVIDVVRAQGASVAAVGSLVDRSGGTLDLGAPHCTMLRLEIPTYEASRCPLCREGSRPEKPGSRSA